MADLEEFQAILCNSKMDIWGIIDAAISVASTEYSGEFHLRRDGIVGRLHQHQSNHHRGEGVDQSNQEVGKQGNAKVDAITVENVNLKTICGKEGVALDTNGKDVSRSHKRSLVSSCEGVVEKKKKSGLRRLSSSDVEDKQKDKEKEKSMEEYVKSNSDSEDDSESVYVDVPDLEFSNFDQDKEEHCFAADQIWAVYDTFDMMPRFYAYIKKVDAPVFKLQIIWLESDPENKLEKQWVRKGLPVVCGRFKRGCADETKDRLIFSHTIAYEKGSKRFSFVVYPRKGEVWALYKDWDLKWRVDPGNHLKYKFEIGEILSDFDKGNGVLVAFMVKVEGFASLFKKTSRAHLARHWIPCNELFRFSHCIPSFKLTGNEKKDVPVGSCELDTASLPDDLDDYYFSNRFPKRLELSSSPSRKDATTIHDFNFDKQNWTFQVGQIWALNLKCYAHIKKIETSQLRLHVDILELCCESIRPNCCGLYKASKSERKVFQRDSFLYLVKAEVIDKNKFIIYPRENEIWVLYKKQDAGDCDFVQVVENNGDIIKFSFLSHVAGFKSVFKALAEVVQISVAESDRFFYRVPAFLLTDEQDGRLRGSWELDLAEFSGLLPS